LSLGDGEGDVILGRPESGYSMKVRSAMRSKGVSQEWMDRCLHTEKLFQSHATVQRISLVLRPNGTATQGSTPIREELEDRYWEPSFHLADPGLRIFSERVEKYSDEWSNELMFHHRWGSRPDQRHRSTTCARGMLEVHPPRLFVAVAPANALIRQCIAAQEIEQCQLRVHAVGDNNVHAAADKMGREGLAGARDPIAMVEIVAPQMAQNVADRAIQVFGGMGVSQDTLLPEVFTQARFCPIADGPDEVHMSQLGRLTIRNALNALARG
jgi:hypothetical protein